MTLVVGVKSATLISQHFKVGVSQGTFALLVRDKSKRLVRSTSTVYEVGRDKLATLVVSPLTPFY